MSLKEKLGAIALAGTMALGVTACEKEITKEIPAQVTLENVYYHEFEPNVPTCLYKNGAYSGSSDEPGESSFALNFRIRIKDPNMVLYEKFEWGNYESRPYPHPQRSGESTNGFGLLGTKKAVYEKNPFVVEVADYKRNVTKHEFTLDKIIKQAKPFTARKKTSKRCPHKIE